MAVKTLTVIFFLLVARNLYNKKNGAFYRLRHINLYLIMCNTTRASLVRAENLLEEECKIEEEF